MFGVSLNEAINYLLSYGEGWAQVILCASAFVEYVFPPFPGDMITLAGALLARTGGWSILLLVLSLTAGSLGGAAVAFFIGARGLSKERILKTRAAAGRGEAIERVLAGYRRYGPIFLAANRFMPGIRAFFFVAAGIAGIRFRLVMLYAGLSALAWNAMLIAAGFIVGDNLEFFESLFRSYFLAAWIVILSASVVLAIVWLRRRN